MTVENIMKLATMYGDARIETIYGSATKDDVQEARADLLAAVEELAKDAERWHMTVLINREVLKHPDSRFIPEAVKAYMDSIHQGFTVEVAVNAAIAAIKGQP